MIGNDIVDLNQAAKESNWKRKGYLEKIFTPYEQLLINSAANPDTMVWLLWTMKESVYKAYSKETKIRSFNPSFLSCNQLILQESGASGSVLHDDILYHCNGMITSAYIHTTASAALNVLNHAVLKITDYDSADSSYKNTNPASVSHHGRHLALIYL